MAHHGLMLESCVMNTGTHRKVFNHCASLLQSHGWIVQEDVGTILTPSAPDKICPSVSKYKAHHKKRQRDVHNQRPVS